MSASDETLAKKIETALTGRIVSGRLQPGARLRQDRIAEEFGASHVPVREAFRRLEARGLAFSEPHKGVRVTSFDVAELREVAEMRASLEALALRHAAPHVTATLLREAERATERAEKARDVGEWEEANRAFHRMLLEPCGMPRLLAAIDDLHLASARFLFAAWRSDWEARTDHDHRAILAALRRGQVDAACDVLARHVGWMGRRGGARQSVEIEVAEKLLD
ncbi:GntR family transcriptional regulator [Nitratireductor pacificus]|uniref:GntR family transcriptional regulator n=1 Tax=Nitratireductor pacificus pht-3B TaxID=391937 RepID=K2MA04_9HYPH|nr:GntR family transcriptional regulator [Nitratireductor pacificus]EKF17840.1 GntR family transcriptional regulator [Nitratireductor pacificus pht-3B]